MLQSQIVGEPYDHITLTDDEAAEGLRLAREVKHYKLQEIAYRQRLTAQKKYPSYSAEELIIFFKQALEIDEDNQSIIENLCFYFSGDSRFRGDLNKGLMLLGGVGVGKTTLMHFFSRNQIQSYRVMSCREIEQRFSTEGDSFIGYCSYNITIATNADPFGHQAIGLCFDDLGTEANAKHYGKEKNVMADIILNRYDNKLPYSATHITSNMTIENIESNYGPRVKDRMREMFNLITFGTTTKSRRI